MNVLQGFSAEVKDFFSSAFGCSEGAADRVRRIAYDVSSRKRIMVEGTRKLKGNRETRQDAPIMCGAMQGIHRFQSLRPWDFSLELGRFAGRIAYAALNLPRSNYTTVTNFQRRDFVFVAETAGAAGNDAQC